MENKTCKQVMEAEGICISKFMTHVFEQLKQRVIESKIGSPSFQDCIEIAEYITDTALMNITGRWCDCKECLDIYRENQKRAKEMGQDLK